MKFTGENQSTRGKTCPSATLSTTNPIWTDPGLTPGIRGERPVTNRLSRGTAMTVFNVIRHLLPISFFVDTLYYPSVTIYGFRETSVYIFRFSRCDSKISHFKRDSVNPEVRSISFHRNVVFASHTI
jgi:hypothetical protein